MNRDFIVMAKLPGIGLWYSTNNLLRVYTTAKIGSRTEQTPSPEESVTSGRAVVKLPLLLVNTWHLASPWSN